MIALTQEKREELTKFARSALNSLNGIEPENPNQYDDCLSEYMQKLVEIALESLTAEPEFYVLVTSAGVWQSFKKCRAEAEFIISRPFNPNYKIVEIFTAPPVPEVNTSNELTALLRAIESFQAIQANDRWNESGKLDDAYGELSEAAIKALPLIKRLKGLGE